MEVGWGWSSGDPMRRTAELRGLTGPGKMEGRVRGGSVVPNGEKWDYCGDGGTTWR